MEIKEKEFMDDLIAKYMANSISSDEWKQLMEWVDENKNNQQYFDQSREIWLAAKINNNKPEFDYRPAFQKFVKKAEIKSEKAIRRIQVTFAKVAAIIVIAFLSGILFQSLLQKTNSNISQFQEISVPLGSRSKVRLPDGTSVVLNAGSTIRYRMDYGAKQRLVYLDGEGFFEVAKDKKRPFIVKTEFIDVKALGTTFNVKAYSADNKVETALVEGLVEIQRTKVKSGNKDEKNIVLLKPKQRYTFLKTEGMIPEQVHTKAVSQEEKIERINKIQVVDARRCYISENVNLVQDISWKDKRWVISREQLGELAIKLGRRYDVTISFEDENLKNYSFTGTLEDESLEQVLKVMSLSSPISYKVKGKQVVFKENKEYLKKYREFFQADK
jgi:ferric-dicitrate binding protein FerR (iron transport regulator)